MKIFAEIKNQLWIVERDVNQVLSENSHSISYTFTPLGNNRFSFILNGKSHLIHLIKENHTYHIHVNGHYFPVHVEDERTRELRQLVAQSAPSGGGQTVYAPIPGLITGIKVREGDQVKKGDGVILLEAMKMENEIRADSDGLISEIKINEGMTVEKDQPLMVIV
jgi:biotin carboxyl carrier protein